MPGFRWMVFEPGSDTRCCYVGSLDEAKEMIDRELSPQPTSAIHSDADRSAWNTLTQPVV